MGLFGSIIGIAKRGLSTFGGPVGSLVASVIPGGQKKVLPGRVDMPDPRFPAGGGSLGRTTKLAGGGRCPPGTPNCGRALTSGLGPCAPPLVYDPQSGNCVTPLSPYGAGALADQFGEAVMGRYGAALIPQVRDQITRRCPKGAVLGNDGYCYNRKDLRNSDRQWPRGTRPLLTGGEMRAIRIASGASRKLQSKQKQLQAMGMLPKPRGRGRKALPAGHHAHVQHN